MAAALRHAPTLEIGARAPQAAFVSEAASAEAGAVEGNRETRRRTTTPLFVDMLSRLLPLALAGSPIVGLQWFLLQCRKRRAQGRATEELRPDMSVASDLRDRLFVAVNLCQAVVAIVAMTGVPLGLLLRMLLGETTLSVGPALFAGAALSSSTIAVVAILKRRLLQEVFPEVFSIGWRDVTQ
mmetsp:Transcript_59489/g.166136  ORF Transcript_59489/g.166136 Transcript_59489/m.166136 type:complete len:183 (-) Transcript_59489:200-748(-)